MSSMSCSSVISGGRRMTVAYLEAAKCCASNAAIEKLVSSWTLSARRGCLQDHVDYTILFCQKKSGLILGEIRSESQAISTLESDRTCRRTLGSIFSLETRSSQGERILRDRAERDDRQPNEDHFGRIRCSIQTSSGRHCCRRPFMHGERDKDKLPSRLPFGPKINEIRKSPTLVKNKLHEG